MRGCISMGLMRGLGAPAPPWDGAAGPSAVWVRTAVPVADMNSSVCATPWPRTSDIINGNMVFDPDAGNSGFAADLRRKSLAHAASGAGAIGHGDGSAGRVTAPPGEISGDVSVPLTLVWRAEACLRSSDTRRRSGGLLSPGVPRLVCRKGVPVTAAEGRGGASVDCPGQVQRRRWGRVASLDEARRREASFLQE